MSQKVEAKRDVGRQIRGVSTNTNNITLWIRFLLVGVLALGELAVGEMTVGAVNPKQILSKLPQNSRSLQAKYGKTGDLKKQTEDAHGKSTRNRERVEALQKTLNALQIELNSQKIMSQKKDQEVQTLKEKTNDLKTQFSKTSGSTVQQAVKPPVADRLVQLPDIMRARYSTAIKPPADESWQSSIQGDAVFSDGSFKFRVNSDVWADSTGTAFGAFFYERDDAFKMYANAECAKTFQRGAIATIAGPIMKKIGSPRSGDGGSWLYFQVNQRTKRIRVLTLSKEEALNSCSKPTEIFPGIITSGEILIK